jgi:hypothetical protein
MGEWKDPLEAEFAAAERHRSETAEADAAAELAAFGKAHPPPDSGGPHPISTLLGMRSLAMKHRGQDVPPCDCPECKPAPPPKDEGDAADEAPEDEGEASP